MRIRLLCQFVLITTFLPASGLVADVIVLRNGGEVRGEFLDNSFAQKSADIPIRTVTGAVITIPRAEVASVTRRRLVYEEYEVRRRNAPDTLEGQWELAEWCRTNDLRDRRQTHLKRILDFNPDHMEARRILGYRHVDGRWLTQDEIMAAKGYVKYKGKYLLPQELELVLQEQKESEAEKAWYRKIKMWYGWLNDNRVERQNDGLAQLRGIRDPNAVPALYRTLSNDKKEDARLLYVAILLNIQDERVLGSLVAQSLQDESSEVRHAAVSAISRIGPEKTLPVYLQALRNDFNTVVNRAGYALGELASKADLPNVVPPLMNALVTTHKYKVRVPDKNPGISIRTDGTMVPPGMMSIPPDIGVMMATGQLPFGVQINEVPPPGFQMRTKVVTVAKEEKNAAVLSALTKLTGRNYGHDIPEWQSWWEAANGPQQRGKQAAR